MKSMASRRDTETGREHEVGVLAGPLLKFNLEEEMQQLRSEGRWQSGHTAKTLAKYPDFRVVLVVMKTGGGSKSIALKDASPSTLSPGASSSAQPSNPYKFQLARC
jgi:hypothetical protein